ncbi:MAG: tetratricopeptide repeat protein, partial [Chakrabartia sp.]
MNFAQKTALLASSILLAASPAFADVKEGVDAWERGDYPTAIKEWRPFAIKGDPDAQFNLAQAYRFGRGVDIDMKQAEDWYRKAANQGHFQAEDNLGLIMFQNGDRQNAMPVIERSAARGDPRAQYVLGTALYNGDHMKQDWVRAYALMTRASAAGLPRASASLAQLDQYIPLEQRQKGLAMARSLELASARPQLPP